MDRIASRPDGAYILFMQACQSGRHETAMQLLPQLELNGNFVLRALEKCWRRGHFELATAILTHFMHKSPVVSIEFSNSVGQGLSEYHQEIPETLLKITAEAYFEGMWRCQPPVLPTTLLAYHRDHNLISWQSNNHLYTYLGRWGRFEIIETLAKICGPQVYPRIRTAALMYGRTSIVENIQAQYPMPLTDKDIGIILERGDMGLVKCLRQCHLLTNEMIYGILYRNRGLSTSFVCLCDYGHWRLFNTFIKIFRMVTGEHIWQACGVYEEHPQVLRTVLQFQVDWRETETPRDAERIFTDWINYLDFSAVYALIRAGCPYYNRVAQKYPEISFSLTVRGIDVLAEHRYVETGFPEKPPKGTYRASPGPSRNIYHEHIDMISAALPEIFPRGISHCVLEYV